MSELDQDVDGPKETEAFYYLDWIFNLPQGKAIK